MPLPLRPFFISPRLSPTRNIISRTLFPLRPFAPRPTTIPHQPLSLPRPYTISTTQSLPKPRLHLARYTFAALLTLTATTTFTLSLRPPTYLEPAISPLATPSSTLSALLDPTNRLGVQGKSTFSLLRSILVYQLCSFTPLIDAAPKIISFAEKVGLGPVVYFFIRRTFFAVFCGGETVEECAEVVEGLRRSGVGSILELSVEADLGQEGASEELAAEWVMSMLKECIEGAREDNFAAVKVTGVGGVKALRDVSEVVKAVKTVFKRLDRDNDGWILRGEVAEVLRGLPNPPEDVEAVVRRFPERVDSRTFEALLSIDDPKTREYFLPNKPSTFPALTTEVIESYDATVGRARELATHAQRHNVRLMIDAEQTYFQPAIDHIALLLARQFNHPTAQPIIFNTYQMYLKSSLTRLKEDEARAREEGYVFAAKLVRGAYMVLERKRAAELGAEDPIHASIEDTHAAYDAGIDFLLDRIAFAGTQDEQAPMFVVATHNIGSIAHAVAGMEAKGVKPTSGTVLFGQLLGMYDRASFTLARGGYGVYKYVPYGGVTDVVPYLLRRAQENSSVLGGVAVEKQLLWDELEDRVFGTGKRRVKDMDASVVGDTA